MILLKLFRLSLKKDKHIHACMHSSIHPSTSIHPLYSTTGRSINPAIHPSSIHPIHSLVQWPMSPLCKWERLYIVQTYSNCGCVGSSGGGSGGEGIGGSARPGLCLPRCNLLIPFAVIMFLMSLIGSVSRVPGTIVMFRYPDVFPISIYRSTNRAP